MERDGRDKLVGVGLIDEVGDVEVGWIRIVQIFRISQRWLG